MTLERAPAVPRVWNRRTELPPRNAVYVGRPTHWANPFAACREGIGEADLASFNRYAAERHRRDPAWLLPLRGRDLVCWCGPGLSHAEILLRLANEPLAPAGDAAQTLEGRVTISEAARLLGCYRSTVRNLITRGVLHAERIGTTRFCDAAEVNALAAQGPRRRGRPCKSPTASSS